PKENCNLEIAEEINVTSDFPFEEVSPASSPNPVVRTEETQQSQAISSCHLKLHGTQYEKSNQFSHIKSGDLTLPGKENSFVGPTLSVGQEELTQVQQMQLSAEMPQILASHPGRLTLPHKITEEIFPGVHAGTLSFSEKVQCYDTDLNKPTSPAKYGGNFRPLEKLGKSGNPLQPIYIENRNLDIKHLALESGVPSFGPRKVVESKSSADALSTTAISGIVTMSLKQKTDSKTRKENVCDSDLKINAGVQTKSVNSTSIEGADVTQAYIYPAMSKFGSSLDSSKCTRCTKPVSIEPEFRTQEISVV
ncbi:protein FAM208B-like, partial [Nannospalax galili]|uniref:protein FAM208B-like n=1 Tax=Nannospalax galili TaxID=1026970 RepID=UPI000819FC90